MGFFNNKFFSNILRAFPTIKYLTFDTVGLDISSDAIRVMKLRQSNYGFTPVFFKEVKYKTKINFNDENFKINECQEIIGILKDLKKELKIEYVVASLPESGTYIYRTEFPKEALTDIASVVRLSIDDNVPLTANDCNFDYFIVESAKKDKIDVVVSVYPKVMIQTYSNLLDGAGLIPVSFESESVAIAESVLDRKERGTFLLVRFLTNKTNVSIIEDGVIQYTSEVWVGSDDMVGDLKNEKIESLKVELTKLLIFWFTNNSGGFVHKKIEKAFFVGDKSTDQNVVDLFEKHLKIPVETGNVWANCFSLDEFIPSIDQKSALNYSVAIGLALKSHKQ